MASPALDKEVLRVHLLAIVCHRDSNDSSHNQASLTIASVTVSGAKLHSLRLALGLPLLARASALGSRNCCTQTPPRQPALSGDRKVQSEPNCMGLLSSRSGRDVRGCVEITDCKRYHLVLSVKGNPALSAFSLFRPRIINHV